MHKQALIRHLAKKNRRPQSHYSTAINEIFEGISEQLVQGKQVTLIGFGTFYTRMRKPGTLFNVRTKQKMQVPALRQAQFRPGDVLKRSVRGKEKSMKDWRQPLKRKTSKTKREEIIQEPKKRPRYSLIAE